MTNVMTLSNPLMRQSVGFDRFNDLFDTLLRETSDKNFDNYPPYNIEKLNEDDYKIVMAVAGFKMEDLNIVLEDGKLTVTGQSSKDEAEQGVEILHRGIATRAFERSFRLADYIKVTDASIADGLLTINLSREIPEEKKPRQIPIHETAKGIEYKSNKKNK